MSSLIWVQTVCKSYQQTTLVGKEFTVAVKNTLASPPNEGCNICVSLEFLYGIWSWLDRKAVNTWKFIQKNKSTCMNLMSIGPDHFDVISSSCLKGLVCNI